MGKLLSFLRGAKTPKLQPLPDLPDLDGAILPADLSPHGAPGFFKPFGTDITGCGEVEIKIDTKGETLWVNTPHGNALRICRITGPIHIQDDRKTETGGENVS